MNTKNIRPECKSCYLPCNFKVQYDNRYIYKCPSCRERYVIIEGEKGGKK